MNRDCRGLCLNPSATVTATATDSNDKESSSNQQQQNNPSVTATQSYQLDRCGFCSLSSTQQQSTPSMNDPMTMLSPSMDCKGNCQLPGLVKHSIVCGQCINQQNEMSTVIDNCGHCLSEGHPCSCDRYVHSVNHNKITKWILFHIVIQYAVVVLIRIIVI